MKHNLLKSVILSVILLMGVSNAWAGGGIYLKPNSNWTQSNARFAAYFFKSSNSSDSKWMSMYASNKNGYYVCAIPDGGYDKVILCRMNPSANDNNWNNKWNQTEDLNVPSDKNIVCSINSGQWDCGNNVTWSAINWYIAGDFNGWNTTVNKMPCDISIESGDHTMKIVSEYGDWFGNTGTMIRGNSSGWIMTYGENSNCTLTADVAGTYNFSCTGTKLTVTYPEQCFLKGSFNDWEETHSILNGSVTVTLAAGTHTFKIHRYDSHGTPYWCGNSGTMSRGNSFEWVMQSDISDNCTLTADRDGDYTFEYNRSTGQLTVKYPGEDYYLTGDFNSWASNTSSSFISNNSITVPLTKGIHKFKIHHIAPLIDAHYGNNGTMTRVACTGWTMETEKDNCKIEADITGDYIFTFDKSTKKVTVEYPEYGEKKTIYLNINEQPTWVDADAKMAVRYDGTNYDMTPIGCDAKGHYLYSCDNIPVEKDIKFVRINPNNTTEIWNESSTYAVPAEEERNCFKMTDWGTGEWITFTEIYPVTLDPHANFKGIDFGSYSVRYNGTTYTSKPTEVVTFYAPVGAQIEILQGNPINNAYYARVRAQSGAYTDILSDDVNGYAGRTIEVCGRTGFDNEFHTKAEHVVYLGVPKTGDAFKKWRDTGYKYFIWLKDCPNGGLVENTESFEVGDITYYEFTIPAGNRNFEFQRKVENGGGATYVNTIEFPYAIPTTNVNCFTLTSENNGYWDILPATNGDYRLIYVEQVVQKSEKNGEEWKTVVKRTKCHPSDIIRQRTTAGVDTVSLHIYTRGQNPEVILQQFSTTTGEWEDIEAHMVNGPLETTPNMGMLPGRKNAGSNSDVDDFVYDNGIEVIKNDSHDDGCGVWNFPVAQDGNGNITLHLTSGNLKRYSGEYYIRTDNAEGGWNNYTAFDNYITYSQYAKDHSGFSHYYCKWVEVSKTPNTKFVIANDYGVAISDTLAKDNYTNEHGDIAHDANIRWSWDIVTNNIARAYIQGTWDVSTSTRNENLVAWYTPNSGGTSTKQLLDDSGDWIYQYDVTVKVGSVLDRLIAEYPVGSTKIQTFAENLNMLIGNPAQTDDYVVRILYDFKINKTIVALVPNDKVANIEIDVLIERVDQGPATQVQAQVNATRTLEGSTVYAVMSFTKDHITGSASKYAKQFYWISFPFDVRVSDVFGFGEYGKHWIIQWYDGAERAKNGCWIDSPTYWRFQTDTTGYILQAGKGYVLTLDLDEMDVFTNTNKVSLYFPSQQTVRTVDQFLIQDKSEVTLEPYTCTIQRNDRWIKDSNWHMLGVPSFANKGMTFTQVDVAYFYQYNNADDTYTPTSSGSFNFNSMFSYMVQFAGTIDWSEFSFTANVGQGLAAKRNTDVEDEQFELMIQLRNANESDQTFVQMREEGATEMFDMNLDLTKMLNSRINIYSLIQGNESNIEVAGNVMPIEETIIPLGVQVKTAGEYTFAMPDGTDGITVELIDYENNTRTNMLLDEYTVNLGKGTFETRFALHVKPDKTVTGLEEVNTNTNGVKKYLINGILYMQKDGSLYDAQGKLVR